MFGGERSRPNPRLQRTRSALLRSPLSRKPLDARRSRLAFATVAVLASRLVASEPASPLALKLNVPSSIRTGQSLVMRFSVSNDGDAGLYFKQPWWWASNGMRVVAKGADGSFHESSVA